MAARMARLGRGTIMTSGLTRVLGRTQSRYTYVLRTSFEEAANRCHAAHHFVFRRRDIRSVKRSLHLAQGALQGLYFLHLGLESQLVNKLVPKRVDPAKHLRKVRFDNPERFA